MKHTINTNATTTEGFRETMEIADRVAITQTGDATFAIGYTFEEGSQVIIVNGNGALLRDVVNALDRAGYLD